MTTYSKCKLSLWIKVKRILYIQMYTKNFEEEEKTHTGDTESLDQCE